MPIVGCCDCGAKQGSEDALKSHICLKHLQWIPYECAHCSANHQHTREPTEHDLLLHINEIHPGQELKYTFHGDSHKQQLLKRKMERSKNTPNDENTISSADHPIPIVQREDAANRIKTEVITIDDDEDDSKPPAVQAAADDQPTNDVTHSTHHDGGVDGANNQLIGADEQWEIKPKTNYDSDSDDDFSPPRRVISAHSLIQQPANSPHPNSSQGPEIKPELIVGDDDDFKPDPPASNTSEARNRQLDEGQCSAEDAMGAGYSPQQPSNCNGTKRKLKRKVTGMGREAGERKTQEAKHKSKSREKAQAGYCLTCKQHKCTFGTKYKGAISNHVARRVCGPRAKAVRIRSKIDVTREMRKLKETHVGAAPRDWPYRCRECKIGIVDVRHHVLKHHLKIDRFECPACGWSGDSGPFQRHVQKKHPSCNTRPINNQKKYKEQIEAIQKVKK